MNTVTALSAQDVMGSRNVSLANRAAQEASLLAEQTGKIDPQRDEELWGAAEGFEKIFLQSMLKQMRETVMQDENSIDSSNASKVYTGLLDEQFAETGSGAHRFGIAKMVHDSMVNTLANRVGTANPG
ncbi:MAG: rod-binding protein [Deltaproteobacteria bacterium]|nr:rod-binding protein [Deltaproteobacteria bacterium]MCB9489012.1 rod-binding protein [Deltaproteobacteria bacterium]